MMRKATIFAMTTVMVLSMMFITHSITAHAVDDIYPDYTAMTAPVSILGSYPSAYLYRDSYTVSGTVTHNANTYKRVTVTGDVTRIGGGQYDISGSGDNGGYGSANKSLSLPADGHTFRNAYLTPYVSYQNQIWSQYHALFIIS